MKSVDSRSGRAGTEKSCVNVVIVGDSMCGKTSLLHRLTTGDFSGDYVPTMFDSAKIDHTCDGKKITIQFRDTAGQSDFDSLRPLAYLYTDVVIICFAINSRNNIDNVNRKWEPEVHHYCNKIPILLVGTKLDLRQVGFSTENKIPVNDHCTKQPVSTQEGLGLAKHLGAVKYIECSAKLGSGMETILPTALHAGLQHRQPKKSISSRLNEKLIKFLT